MTAIFSRFSKVAIATSDFMNKVYNGGFSPEFSVSMLKETIALVRDYVSEIIYIWIYVSEIIYVEKLYIYRENYTFAIEKKFGQQLRTQLKLEKIRLVYIDAFSTLKLFAKSLWSKVQR